MTYKQKMGFSTFLLAALILVAGTFVYMRITGASASEKNDYGEITWQTKLSADINGDSKEETVYLTSYLNGSEKHSTISSKLGLFGVRTMELKGFEEDLAFCPKWYFPAPDGSILICIFGEVGVHSQNIQVLSWIDFSSVPFVNSGVNNDNITSDEPNFDFVYTNKDNVEMYFDNRDYNNDPLVDIIRSHYYLGNNAFYFAGSESIKNEGMIK